VGGAYNAYVAKLDPRQAGAAALVYGALLGGAGDSEGYGVATDGAGDALVTGYTTAGDFPLAWRSPRRGHCRGGRGRGQPVRGGARRERGVAALQQLPGRERGRGRREPGGGTGRGGLRGGCRIPGEVRHAQV